MHTKSSSAPFTASRHAYRGPVAAAIFDWAGTVLDFGCMAPVDAFQQVFDDAGVPITAAEARAPMGAAKREHIALILAMPEVQESWQYHFGEASTEQDIDRLHTAFLHVDTVNIKCYSTLIPGALETIETLRSRGIRIGSTTGYPREVMSNLLSLAREQGYEADHCCTVSDVTRGHPWPDMCLANAHALNVSDVRACVVIDDSPSGLAAGRAAGMWTVGIAASGNEVGLPLEYWSTLDATEQERLLVPARQRLLDAGAHAVIDSIADLVPVIDAIEAQLAAGTTP